MLFILYSCKKEDEVAKIITLEEFIMEVPGTWDSFAQTGYDSKVGGVTNGKDELLYDYGWQPYNFSNLTSDTHTRTATIIDNKPAVIVQPNIKGTGIIGVYITVDGLIDFNMYGENIEDEETVLKIFNSIKFKN